MQDWTKLTDEQVFTAVGEQAGSQASYWRETEIRRREFLLTQQVLKAQIASAEAQQSATLVMKRQATVAVWSTVFAAASALAALATAVVTFWAAK